MKRVLSAVLVVVMLFSLMPAAFADEVAVAVGGVGSSNTDTSVIEIGGICGNSVYWTFDQSSGTLTISGEGDMYDYNEGDQLYYDYMYDINRIVIEEGVTSIGDCAFQYCSVREISFPSTLKSIGEFAFAKADELYKIEYNGCSIENIDDRAFYGCWSLDNFYIFNSECEIGEGVFDEAYDGDISGFSDSTAETYANTYGVPFNCMDGTCGENLIWKLDTDFELIIAPMEEGLSNKMTEWGGGVWMPWDDFGDDIKSVTILDGVTDITRYAFTCYHNIETITIPESVCMFEEVAIHDCRGLKDIKVSSDSAYYVDVNGVLFTKDMNVLIQYPAGKEDTYYSIPDNVYTISEGAFAYNNNLVEINIPSSVSTVTEGAFGIADSLQSITVADESEFYRGIDGILFTKDLDGLIVYPAAKPEDYFTVPDYVDWIAADAFNSAEFYGVSFYEGLESIGTCAFGNCRNLTEVDIPSTVTNIERSAFADCVMLTNVTIGEGTSYIGKRAFQGCYNMNEITIYANVAEIEADAFDCGSGNLVLRGYRGTLVEEYALNNGINFVALDDEEEPDIVYQGMCGDNVTWMFDSLTGEMVIGGEGEMYNFDEDANPPEYAKIRDRVNRVMIEDGVTSIGDCAFQYFSDMTEVVLPASLSYIGVHAFAKSALSHIEYNNCMIDVIADEAFYGCWELSDFFVYNPNCHIGSTAFAESGITALVGYTNSTAENYAMNNGLNFTALDGGEEPDEPTPEPEPEPEPEPDDDRLVFPIEFRFHEDTYFNGSMQATINLMDMSNSANNVTATVRFNEKEPQYVELAIPNHNDSSRYNIRVVYNGTIDTNINIKTQYFYAKDGGLTAAASTTISERAIFDYKPTEPVVIYAPQKNTVNGKLNLPEEYWCEDEDAKLTSLWVEILDGADEYIGFAEAEVDENLNYSFELPTNVMGNYTLMARPVFTKGEEEEIVNPKTNLILKYYELYDQYGNKQYYGVGTDNAPVYGANFDLTTGYVVSGTLHIPDGVETENSQLYMSVSGYKPETYDPENCEGDYYFEIEYEEGRTDYNWYFAIERDTEIVIGYNLYIANQNEVITKLLDGTFFSRDWDGVTDNFDDATRYWMGEDCYDIRMELQKGRKFEVRAQRPENMNYDKYVYIDVELKSLEGDVISRGVIEIQEGEDYGEIILNIPDGYEDIYVMYDVDEGRSPDTWLFDLPVYVSSNGEMVKHSIEDSEPWNINDTLGVGFTLILSDEINHDFSDDEINDFLNEVYYQARDYHYDDLYILIKDSREILEYMGADYIGWDDSSDNIRREAIRILVTKINWLAIELTIDIFVEDFSESLNISRITRTDSFEEMRDRLYETGHFMDVLSRIETLKSPETAYRKAFNEMQSIDINTWDEIESRLWRIYEDMKSNENPPSGGSGGGGVSLTINAIDSNTLEIIENAQIFVTNEDESVNESGVTDYEGKVYFAVDSGVYSVQAIANGYQMRNFVVEKTDDNFEFTVYMSQNDILQVETNVKEMTYDEIIDAGIDVDAIENKQVYNCTAVLTFTPSVSGSTGGGTLPNNITFDYICTDTEVFNAEPVRFGNTSVCPVAKDIYLIIYSSTTWLKEMFEVQLLVTNTSAIERIRDCVANLNLPEGLSLAVMNDEIGQQSEDISIGIIEPNENADVRWYLCGDAEGEYTIGGTVWGIREGGGISEDISVRFTSKDKISVFGGEALNLTIRAEKAATVGEPYRVEYILRNVSPKELYNVEINILGGRFLTEYSVEDLTPPYGWEGSLENGFIYRDAVLESGETLSGVFEVIFAEGIDTDYAEYVLSNMFVVAGNGSTVNVPTDIELVDEIITHNWDSGTITKEPTCEEDGEITYGCTDEDCDDVKITKIPAKGHDWDEGVITLEPTETAEGEKTFTCSRCEATKTEPVKRNERQDVSFLVDEINYTYGDRTAIYHYAYNDSEGGGELTYSSSNEDVATVDHRGKVTIHNAGEAIITATAAAVPGRYVETSTSYKLIINKAELHIRANDNTIYYGDAPKGNGYVADGFVNGENTSVLRGRATYSYDYERYGDPGQYNIAVSGLSARNYDIWYEDGVLQVERAIDYEINIGNLTQRKGSVESVTVSTTPRDDSARFEIEYQNIDGVWQSHVPTDIGEYLVRATLVYSHNIEFDPDRWTEATLIIKAGAMIDVGGDTGGVDVGIDTSDEEKVEIIVDDAALEEVINNIPPTGEVVIDVKGNGEKKELVLPSNLVSALHESEQAKEVTVIADDTEICVSPDALKKVAETMENNDKVGISIGAVEKDNLNEEQQQALDAIAKDAVVLSLNMVVSKFDDDGNKVAEEKIHEFDGKVNVRAAYEMPDEDNGKRVIVCYVSDNGSVTYIRAEYIDGYVEFETDHFSHFAIMTIGGEPGVNVSLRTTEEFWHFDNITVGEYEGDSDEATAYIGIYNENNVLIGAKTEVFSLTGIDSVPVEKIDGAKYAMVYVWENGTMKPLTDKPKSIELK